MHNSSCTVSRSTLRIPVFSTASAEVRRHLRRWPLGDKDMWPSVGSSSGLDEGLDHTVPCLGSGTSNTT